MGFGKYVRGLRIKKGIGLREFAKMVGVSPTFISKMEKEDFDPPKEANVKKMARILGVDEDFLLGKAKKIPTDVKKIITSQDSFIKKVPEFLRVANKKSLTEEDWDEIIRKLEERR